MEFYRKINPDDFINYPPKPTYISKSPSPPSIIQAKNIKNNPKNNNEPKAVGGHLSNGECKSTTANPKVIPKPAVESKQEQENITSNKINIPKQTQDKNDLATEEVAGSPHICPPRVDCKDSSTNHSDKNGNKTASETAKITEEITKIRKMSRELHWRMDPSYVKHKGGCHCGAVRFEVYGPETPRVLDCNCSICIKKQNRHFIVPESHFKLLKGHDSLTTYTFNTHKAKHTFCSVCGVQSFYIPRSNSDGYGIVLHCLDPGTAKKEKPEKFDGQNWEEEIAKKPHIAKFSKIF